MKNKRFLTTLLAGSLALGMSFTSLAGQWVQEGDRWRYQHYDGTFVKAESGMDYVTYLIDGDDDGIAELYYFDENGYMMANTDIVMPAWLWFPEVVFHINSDGVAYEDGKPRLRAISLGTIDSNIFKGLIKSEYSILPLQSLEFVDANFGTRAEDRKLSRTYLGLTLPDGFVNLGINSDKVTEIMGSDNELLVNPNLTVEEINSTLGIEASEKNGNYTWVLQEEPYVEMQLILSLNASGSLEERLVYIRCFKE